VWVPHATAGFEPARVVSRDARALRFVALRPGAEEEELPFEGAAVPRSSVAGRASVGHASLSLLGGASLASARSSSGLITASGACAELSLVLIFFFVFVFLFFFLCHTISLTDNS
jgi:hypothetical protein